MYLNIGEQRISVNVPFANQDFVREVEKKVNRLYTKFSRTFPSKANREIFAMVAYQYASYYEELLARYDKATELATDCLDGIDADLKTSLEDSEDTFEPDFSHLISD